MAMARPTLPGPNVPGRVGRRVAEILCKGATMRIRGQEISERSALHLLGLEETVEPSGHDWERDAQLLNALAFFSETRSQNLLRKISWSLGENADLASFHEGRPLSGATRTRLQTMLKERMRVEEETIENCRHASAQITQLVAFFVGLAVVAFLLFR
jgi:hypothetical protein